MAPLWSAVDEGRTSPAVMLPRRSVAPNQPDPVERQGGAEGRCAGNTDLPDGYVPGRTVQRRLGVRVLVISEQADERLRATTALHLRDDVEVVEAITAEEGRALVQAEDFDVLVIDGDLRPQGGFSLLYEIREGGEYTGEPTPPALVMIAREQDRFLSDWSGANELLLKPVDPFEVAARVTALAGESAAPQDVAESGDQVAATTGAEGNAGLAPR